MPKIQQIKRLEHSFDNKQYQRKIIKQGQLSFKEQNHAYYTAKPIPIHQTSYNPQFSKSPLASLQISKNYNRKNINQTSASPRNIQINNQYTTKPEYITNGKPIYGQQNQGTINCKQILYWIIGGLLLIGLAIGLYLLIDSLLGKKDIQNKSQLQTQYNPESYTYNNKESISPIIVSPVPYAIQRGISNDYMKSVSSAFPITYISSLPNKQKFASTETLINDQIPNTYVDNPASSVNYYSTASVSKNNLALQQNLSFSSSDNSVAPIDLYSVNS